MPVLPHSTYVPPGFIRNEHLMTVIPNVVRFFPGIEYQRSRINTEDGDFVDVDFLDNGGHRAILLSHGLEGNSRSTSVLGMANHFKRLGWDIWAWNMRSCSGSPNKTRGFYHPMQTRDYAQVVDFVRQQKSYSEIGLVGFSFGGAFTLNYIAEEAEQLPKEVKRAVVFSTPCDLGATSRHLSENTNNSWYGKLFLRKYKAKIAAKAKLHPDWYDLGLWDKIKTVADFDLQFNCNWYGFERPQDFYTYVSPVTRLHQIRIPTLIVNAADDPVLPTDCYPTKEVSRLQKVFLEVPESGGHVGFVRSSQWGGCWSETRAERFLTGKG